VLLRHIAKHCYDYHVAHDLDAVLDVCTSPESREIVKAYARARRNAPGWNPRSYEPGKRHNSHTAEMIPQLLEKGANARCAECGAPLQAFRKSAKFCSNTCRVRSHRKGTCNANESLRYSGDP
jgi:hypothetical protein